MRFYFKTKQFKMIVLIVALIVVFSIVAATIGGVSTINSGIVGSIIAPFQKVVTSISDSVEDFFTKLNDGQKLMDQNKALLEENALLNDKLVDYYEKSNQNEFLKGFLSIKEENPEMTMEPASLIYRDSSDVYAGFTIDKGLLNGISLNDPVITSQGVVGYISEVSPSYSKVRTVLSCDINVGAKDIRTSEIGVVSGRLELSKSGKTSLKNLSRSSNITIGDTIVTTGGSIFPKGLIIGNVDGLEAEVKDTSLYAIVQPAVNIFEVRDVMVVTYFFGQGDYLSGKNGG